MHILFLGGVCVPVDEGYGSACASLCLVLGFFGRAVHVRTCVSASSSLSPQGLEVTAVRKQIDFSPPTHNN